MTADGFVARQDGTSQWITGEIARAHAHRERARSDAILVGGRTLRTDEPRLDVRLPGLEDRSPRRLVLTKGAALDGWRALREPEAIRDLDAQYLLVEGGAGVADAFLSAGLVDRLLLYRARLEFGEGMSRLPSSRRPPVPPRAGCCRPPPAWQRHARSLHPRPKPNVHRHRHRRRHHRELSRSAATCACASPARSTPTRSPSARRSPARACA